MEGKYIYIYIYIYKLLRRLILLSQNYQSIIMNLGLCMKIQLMDIGYVDNMNLTYSKVSVLINK